MLKIRRKGQFVSLITVFALIFIASGNFFGATLVQERMSKKLSYSAGGLSSISEAKIRADFYPERMEKEFNYSINISTVELGKNEQKPSWDEEDFTGNYEDTMRTNLKSDLEKSIKREVNSQTFISNCGEGPPAEYIKVENSGWEIESFSTRLDADEPVTCERGSTKASVYIDRTESDFSLKNHYNNYLRLAGQAVKVGAHIEAEGDDTIPSSISVTGSASECSSDTLRPIQISNLKDDARADAVSDAEAQLDSSSALDELVSSYGGKLDQISFSPSESSISINSDESTENGDCDLDSEDDVSDDGHWYFYKTNSYEPDSVTLTYSVWEKGDRGGKKKLFTNNGLEAMLFKFEYSQNFN